LALALAYPTQPDRTDYFVTRKQMLTQWDIHDRMSKA
jgi:hypothetical protein